MVALKVQFGKRLKFLRKQLNLTQEQLAESTGLTIESISNIERGLFGPKFDNLEKIAAAIGVEAQELIEFSNRYSFLSLLSSIKSRLYLDNSGGQFGEQVT
jgi:transcriptional regulator with XRE-family HTH domain